MEFSFFKIYLYDVLPLPDTKSVAKICRNESSKNAQKRYKGFKDLHDSFGFVLNFQIKRYVNLTCANQF